MAHTSKTSEILNIVNIVNAVIDFSGGARTSALGSVLSLIKKKQGAGLLFEFSARNVLQHIPSKRNINRTQRVNA